MPLELSQLHGLRDTGRGAIFVEYLPLSVASYLACPLGIAYLSADSLAHILNEHRDVQLLDLVCLPDMVRNGTWVEEPKRPTMACVVYDHPETGIRFKGAIKATGGGFETYISTFHRCAERQSASIFRRGQVLCGGIR